MLIVRFRPSTWAIVELWVAVWLVPAAAQAPSARPAEGLVSLRTARTLYGAHSWLDDALGRSEDRRGPASGDDTLEDAQDSRTGHTPGLSPDHHGLSPFDAPFDPRRAGTPFAPEPVVARLLSDPHELAAPRPPPAV